VANQTITNESAESRKKELDEFQRKLKHAQASQPQYVTCKFLFDAAKKRNLWLFDPQTKRWFSPEEFFGLYNKYPVNDKIFQRVEIKDPVEGLQAGHQQLTSIQNRLEIFGKKVIEYYAGRP